MDTGMDTVTLRQLVQKLEEIDGRAEATISMVNGEPFGTTAATLWLMATLYKKGDWSPQFLESAEGKRIVEIAHEKGYLP